MAYEFMSLAEVEALPEVPESATVLAEVDGSIKRIPSAGLGGGGAAAFYITNGDYMFKSPQGAIAKDETDKVSRDEFVAALNCGVVRLYAVSGDVSDFYFRGCYTVVGADLEDEQGIIAQFMRDNNVQQAYTKEIRISV